MRAAGMMICSNMTGTVQVMIGACTEDYFRQMEGDRDGKLIGG
jgi:hypothetical protein